MPSGNYGYAHERYGSKHAGFNMFSHLCGKELHDVSKCRGTSVKSHSRGNC